MPCTALASNGRLAICERKYAALIFRRDSSGSADSADGGTLGLRLLRWGCFWRGRSVEYAVECRNFLHAIIIIDEMVSNSFMEK